MQITTGEAYLVHTKRLHSNSHFNQYLSALYKVVGTFLFGAAVSQSLTDLAKFTIGRPRPNFLAVCAPVACNGYMLQINCTGNHRNVTESRCSTETTAITAFGKISQCNFALKESECRDLNMLLALLSPPGCPSTPATRPSGCTACSFCR